MTFSRPMTNAAPPALAEYSRASPGAPWEVSVPIATPYRIICDPTIPRHVWIAAVPALQANSKSAAVRLGVAPTAWDTTVAVGFTAYGWDSDPTYSAPICCGSIAPRMRAVRRASVEIVIVSSSGAGTLLRWTFSDWPMPSPSEPHTRPISIGVIRYRGTYAP